jgi:hypothetical protein
MQPSTIFAGASAIGGGLNAIGSYFGARTARSNARLQADISRINARIAELQGRDALLLGRRQEQASRMKTAQTKSSARAALAANGIDLGSDLATALNASTDYIGETDANTIAANAIKSAWGYRNEAASLRAQAAMGEAAADSMNPALAGLTSLLGSATAAAPTWYSMRKGGRLT